MSPKLKKLIISMVVVFIVFIAALVAYSIFAKISTTVVYDLRIVDAETDSEIFDKEVYLHSSDDNKFDIKLEIDASSKTQWVVESSDKTVAKVEPNGRNFTVTYLKAGTTTITAHASDADADVVNDSFILTVKENFPVSFVFDDERAKGSDNIYIFADNKDYIYKFSAKSLNDDSVVNLDDLYVVDDYNKDVFEYIYIDATNSTLVLKAKQSADTVRENITIQSKSVSDAGQVFYKNFLLLIDVKGNYVSNLQLQVSSNPNFEGDVYICGDGVLNPNEKVVSAIVFVDEVRTIYARVRVAYTNGDIKYITENSTINTLLKHIDVTKIAPSEDYIVLYANSDNESDTLKIVRQEISFEKELYFYNKDSEDYKNFEKGLYHKVHDSLTHNFLYYEYVYWDLRYARSDAITVDGKIIGFIGEDPGYEYVEIETEISEE